MIYYSMLFLYLDIYYELLRINPWWSWFEELVSWPNFLAIVFEFIMYVLFYLWWTGLIIVYRYGMSCPWGNRCIVNWNCDAYFYEVVPWRLWIKSSSLSLYLMFVDDDSEYNMSDHVRDKGCSTWMIMLRTIVE